MGELVSRPLKRMDFNLYTTYWNNSKEVNLEGGKRDIRGVNFHCSSCVLKPVCVYLHNELQTRVSRKERSAAVANTFEVCSISSARSRRHTSSDNCCARLFFLFYPVTCVHPRNCPHNVSSLRKYP